MKLAIGSDHAGYELKENLIKYLKDLGHEVTDYGTYSTSSCDYPDFAKGVAEDVASKVADFGIVICYTGIGISIAANKYKGIRCALVRSSDEVILTREHNDANILALGAKYTPLAYAKELVSLFINTEFSGLEKHQRRIDKVKEIER